MIEHYIATCPDETKGLLAQELKNLGAQDVREEYKAVTFSAPRDRVYEIHLKLRTASRLLKVIKEAAATNEIILEKQAGRIHWDRYIPKGATFLVEGVAGDRGEGALSSNQISKAVRLGLEDYYNHNRLPLPKVDLKEPSVSIVAFVYKKRVTISLDSSGKTLHKRGYRMGAHPAPLKETLASSLLMLAGYDGSQTLFDPMCGSGTIAIEAAYIALHKAALIHRRKGDFGFEHWRDFDKELWRKVQDHVRLEREGEPSAPIFARDIAPQYVDSARQNALRARVEKHIQFSTGSFFECEPPAAKGLLVTNLPYGERIGQKDMEAMKTFYQEIGNTLKRKYAGWTACLLVAEEAPYKFIGLKPRRKIAVLNGSIRCKFLIFELYEGKKFQNQEAETIH